MLEFFSFSVPVSFSILTKDMQGGLFRVPTRYCIKKAWHRVIRYQWWCMLLLSFLKSTHYKIFTSESKTCMLMTLLVLKSCLLWDDGLFDSPAYEYCLDSSKLFLVFILPSSRGPGICFMVLVARSWFLGGFVMEQSLAADFVSNKYGVIISSSSLMLLLLSLRLPLLLWPDLYSVSGIISNEWF